jgi:LmbE family N-acetylglucosaminyl deacetylase
MQERKEQYSADNKFRQSKNGAENESMKISPPKWAEWGIEFIPEKGEIAIANTQEVRQYAVGSEVIIVEPHPDDSEISMAGLEVMLPQAFKHVTILGITTGYNGVTDAYAQNQHQATDAIAKGQIRICEAKSVAASVPGIDYEMLNITFPGRYAPGDHDKQGRRIAFDSKYNDMSQDDRNRLEAFIDDKNTTQTWILPYPFKKEPHHQAHEKTTRAFLEILWQRRFMGEVWFYETCEREVDFDIEGVRPNMFVLLGKSELNQKKQLMDLFKSQISRDPGHYATYAERNINYAHNYIEQHPAAQKPHAVERFLRGRLQVTPSEEVSQQPQVIEVNNSLN